MQVYHDFFLVPGSRSTFPDTDPDPANDTDPDPKHLFYFHVPTPLVSSPLNWPYLVSFQAIRFNCDFFSHKCPTYWLSNATKK